MTTLSSYHLLTTANDGHSYISHSPPNLSVSTSVGAEDDLIDPVTMPYCEHSSCWQPRTPPPDICPLLDAPCPDDSDASENGGSKCGMKQYRRDCYCSLKTGLSCAFPCGWKIWWQTEDWFERVCPDAPATVKLDFGGLPGCARDCIDDAVFQVGCLTQTSNCFCAHGSLFGCQEKCGSEEEWAQVVEWLQQVCDIDSTVATQALENGMFDLEAEEVPNVPKELSPPSPPPAESLRWDEIFILIVGCLTGVVAIGCLSYNCIMKKRKAVLYETRA